MAHKEIKTKKHPDIIKKKSDDNSEQEAPISRDDKSTDGVRS